MKKIKDLLIDKINAILEFKVLAEIGDAFISSVLNSVQTLIDDQFIQTATETGIARREKMLKIQPFADDTLDTRRFRIETNWNNTLPYTYSSLINKIESVVNKGDYEITLLNEEYDLTIKVSLGQKRLLQEIDKIARAMSPANLIIKVQLKYNRYVDVGRYTHEYLGNKTYEQLKEEALY